MVIGGFGIDVLGSSPSNAKIVIYDNNYYLRD
jgi:hypothetical protein